MSPDFKDLLSEFNAHGVEYLVVGAYALAAHGRVRATGDLTGGVRKARFDPVNDFTPGASGATFNPESVKTATLHAGDYIKPDNSIAR
ncbi:MAG: hypothetical protein EXR27_04290 [Betaproteobacteria bacterium]|nr:hypothetical protein [Betaproteobacteria bacterium]